MTLVRMQTPEGFEYAVVSTEWGNAQVDANGVVEVDARAANALVGQGFGLVGPLATGGGRYTATADDATAGTVDIDTGMTTISAQMVQVLRAGNISTDDADVTVVDGVITVADGATYVITAGDVINWIAYGTFAEAE